MKNALLCLAAVVAGFLVGSCVNMGLIQLGAIIIPLPPGADTSTSEGFKAALPLFETKHFLFPFLAHAIGVLAGAAVAAFIAPIHKLAMAMVIGSLFMAAGIYVALTYPSPMWFDLLDIVFAYLPMAWLGWKLTSSMKR
jgi:hypothetical protein